MSGSTKRTPPHLEGARDCGKGMYISKYPDVCKSPKVPIPYNIVAYESDDANTAATVRYTKKRAHNMGSIVTKCFGDEPGTGLGVKSGTVGSVCHPKGHSSTVRVEGKWAVRHGDEVYMNNRNTIGKRVRQGSTATIDYTPPFYAFAAEEIEPEPANDEQIVLAQALPAPSPAPSPGPASPPVGRPGNVVYPDFPQWKQQQPGGSNWVWNGAKWVRRGSGILLFLEVLLYPSPIGFQHRPPWEIDSEIGPPELAPLIDDARRWYEIPGTDPWELQQWYQEQRPRFIPPPIPPEEVPISPLETDLRPKPAPTSQGEEVPEDDPLPVPVPIPEPGLSVKDDDDDDDDDCPYKVGKYKQKCEPGQQDHHIYNDYVFRSGARPDSSRYATNPGQRAPWGAPFIGAPSICLPEGIHSGLHTTIRVASNSTFNHIDSLDNILALHKNSLLAVVPPACHALIQDAVQGLDNQFLGQGLQGRGRELGFSKGSTNQTALETVWGY